jgi:hypothetical protein
MARTQPGAGVEELGAPRRIDPLVYALLVLTLLVMVALLPATVLSIRESFVGSEDVYHQFPDGRLLSAPELQSLEAQRTSLNLTIIDVDEAQRTVQIAVSGKRSCGDVCDQGVVVDLVAYNADSRVLRGVGRVSSVSLPDERGFFSTSLDLPVAGRPSAYPFDRYRLRLGISASHEVDGERVPYDLDEMARNGAVTVRDSSDSLILLPPAEVPLAEIDDPEDSFDPIGAVDLTLARPTYLRVLAVALFAMVAITSMIGLFSRSLPAVVFGNTGILLSIFSIRSVLVPPGIGVLTTVEVAGQLVILLMLAGLVWRISVIIRRRSGLALVPFWPAPREDVERSGAGPQD